MLETLGEDFKIVKDPVHTSVRLPSCIFQLIDDPLFQRLRFIKQTGLSHYVYPGLRHSRFEHSLGVAHLMLTAIESIERNVRHVYGPDSEAYRLIRRVSGDKEYLTAALAAALLHDIGHLAWSHVFEAALRDLDALVSCKSGSSAPISIRSHEELTTALSSLLLSKHERVCGVPSERITGLVQRILGYAYTSLGELRVEDEALWVPARLLSGTIDVDRGDYLLRDSRSAGVSYGLYDLDRLISVMVLAEDPPARLPEGVRHDVGVVDKGVSVVENMLIGRMYMYSEVYLHDVVLAYEASAARLLSLIAYAALEAARRGDRVEGFEGTILECISHLTMVLGEGEDGERTELCARLLTDPAFETLTEMIATGSSQILEYLARVDPGACASLRLYAMALTSRRHPPSFYLSGRRASMLVSRIDGGRRDALAVLNTLPAYRESLEDAPLIIVSYVSYPIYSRSNPVVVVSRETRRAYALHELDVSSIGELLGKDTVYSKVVVAFPPIPEIIAAGRPPHPALRLRPGKLTLREFEKALSTCGYGEEDAGKLLRATREKLEEILDVIGEIVTGR